MIKQKITLSAPRVEGDMLRAKFEIDYIYVNDDQLTVYVKPGALMMTVALDTSSPELVDSKTCIRLNAAQSAKVSGFISALENAIKSKLEEP
jgi:hypothetical protein